MPDVEDPLLRDCCLLPWFPEKMMDDEWMKQLSAETTLESARNQLSEFSLKVCVHSRSLMLSAHRKTSLSIVCLFVGTNFQTIFFSFFFFFTRF